MTRKLDIIPIMIRVVKAGRIFLREKILFKYEKHNIKYQVEELKGTQKAPHKSKVCN